MFSKMQVLGLVQFLVDCSNAFQKICFLLWNNIFVGREDRRVTPGKYC